MFVYYINGYMMFHLSGLTNDVNLKTLMLTKFRYAYNIDIWLYDVSSFGTD